MASTRKAHVRNLNPKFSNFSFYSKLYTKCGDSTLRYSATTLMNALSFVKFLDRSYPYSIHQHFVTRFLVQDIFYELKLPAMSVKLPQVTCVQSPNTQIVKYSQGSHYIPPLTPPYIMYLVHQMDSLNEIEQYGKGRQGYFKIMKNNLKYFISSCHDPENPQVFSNLPV